MPLPPGASGVAVIRMVGQSARRSGTAGCGPERHDRLHVVPSRPGPGSGHGVHLFRDGVGGSLVVRAPADEVRPGGLRIPLEWETHLAQPFYRVEEILIGERDPVAVAHLVGHVDAHRLRDPDEAGEPAA